MELSIFSLVIGSFVTWLVSKWYYNRSKDDFALLMSKIDKFVAHNQTAGMNTNENTIDFQDKKFNDVLLNMDTIGDAILTFAKTSGKDIGTGDSGAPIFALNELIDRIDRIQKSLQSYRNWRVHLGA